MLVESPCRRDPRLMAEVRRRSEAPISEHIGSLEFAMQLVEHEAVDIFNIATVSLGGITGAKKLYALAEAAGIQTLIGTTQEASIGTSAQAHLGAAVPNLDFPADCMGPVLYQRDIVRQPVRYEGGCLIVPEGVGLGMAVDEAKLQEAGE
jgi:muconate cycloisomerase